MVIFIISEHKWAKWRLLYVSSHYYIKNKNRTNLSHLTGIALNTLRVDIKSPDCDVRIIAFGYFGQRTKNKFQYHVLEFESFL